MYLKRLLKTTGMAACIGCCTCMNTGAQAQNGRDSLRTLKDSTVKTADTLSKGVDKLKAYKQIITAKAVAYKSFLTVQEVSGKYFLEIPDSLMNRRILVVNQVTAAPANNIMPGRRQRVALAGDMIGQSLFYFEKAPANRLLMRTKSYQRRSADSSVNGLAGSLSRNSVESILNTFTIAATNDSAHTMVIDITEMLAQDNLLFGFDLTAKNEAGLGMVVRESSYVDSVMADDGQVSFSLLRTYSKSQATPDIPATFRLQTTMLLLAESPMPLRVADSRVGFQGKEYVDFDSNPLGADNRQMILRWRLEPSDRNAYLSGRSTTPLKPITFYLDPSIPEKWKPAVKAGIEAWNKAFEKAGFKQAIRVVQPIAGEITMLASRNGVFFMPGDEKENPHLNMITDPRSGEIIYARLHFYLGALNKMYKQYFLQAGALDKAANKPTFDDALMSRLVEVYIMQKMGRLLGLTINAGASSENDIASLRNNSWLKSNAFNGSATDPVLVNYVAQPEDKIDVKYLLPKISDIDAWTINRGYRLISRDEKKTLNGWIAEYARTGRDAYCGEPDPRNNPVDPRVNPEDLGNDIVTASALGIRNLKIVLPNILAWTAQPATDNSLAGQMYSALLDQYAGYVTDVINELGGIYIHGSSSPAMPRQTLVPLPQQKKAMQFLKEYVLTMPAWLVDRPLYGRTGQNLDSVLKVQHLLLKKIMSADVLQRLQSTATRDSAGAFSPFIFLQALSEQVFSRQSGLLPLTLPERELAYEYVVNLLALIKKTDKETSDLPAILRSHARLLLKQLKTWHTGYTGIDRECMEVLYENLLTGLYSDSSNTSINSASQG